MTDTAAPAFVSTGVPALDAILGGGFCLGRLTQLRSSRWDDVAHVVDALRAAVPGPVIPLDLDAEPVGKILAAAQTHRVVYVDAPAVDPDSVHGHLHAGLMARFARDLCAKAYRHADTAIVFFTRVPVRSGVTFGASEVEGNALKFYCSVRVDLRPTESGVLVKTVKNKLVAPFRSVRLDVIDGAPVVLPDPADDAAVVDGGAL